MVMAARGTYGNPFLFREITAALKNRPVSPPTVEERMDTMLRHIRLILACHPEKPPEISIREARKHAAWYMMGLPDAARFRNLCYHLETYAAAEQLAADVLTAARRRD